MFEVQVPRIEGGRVTLFTPDGYDESEDRVVFVDTKKLRYYYDRSATKIKPVSDVSKWPAGKPKGVEEFLLDPNRSSVLPKVFCERNPVHEKTFGLLNIYPFHRLIVSFGGGRHRFFLCIHLGATVFPVIANNKESAKLLRKYCSS